MKQTSRIEGLIKYMTEAERKRRDCERSRKYYRANKEKALAYAKKYRLEHIEKIRGYYKKWCAPFVEALRALKAETGCVVCGEKDPLVLDYHHLNPTEKSFTVSRVAIKEGFTPCVLAEIAKCEILCANDHRRKHSRCR